MSKTLVTGGTGFVGLHLARELARRGDDLRLLVREASNIGPLEGIDWELAKGDVTDRDSVRKAMRGSNGSSTSPGRLRCRRAAATASTR
jgi:dihydroflavonol-4-reductase